MSISEERVWRSDKWNIVRGQIFSPSEVIALQLYAGQAGIYRDVSRTGRLRPGGVTVSVLHRGFVYDDDLFDDGVLYHYPNTNRPGNADLNEINATKAAAELGLPLFVIIGTGDGKKEREIRLAEVEDWDDENELFLMTFLRSESEVAPKTEGKDEIEEDFQLRDPGRQRGSSTVTLRRNQQRFRFQVLKRMGTKCSVCDVAIESLLDAAHICPVGDGGSDDPRNGLLLCKTHHKAFDSGLIRVNPNSLEIEIAEGHDRPSLGVVESALVGDNLPHRDALEWAYENSMN